MRISAPQVLIFAIIFTLTISIHIQKHNKYDQGQYLQALEKQQSNFQAGINELGESVQRVDGQVNQTEVIDQKISLLQGAVVDQEDQIFQLSSQMIPPLNLSTCNCQQLSAGDRQALAKRADVALQRINQLKKQLNSAEGRDDDAQFVEMKKNADSQIFYLESIKNVLNSNCTTQAILGPTVYQSNVYAPNWILGNQKINDLVQKYIERSKKYDSITNCPIDTPFYNGQKCINCKGDASIFNMETQKCVSCPKNSRLNSKLRECVDSTQYVNNLFTKLPWVAGDVGVTATLKSLADQIESGKYQYCPKETPFLVEGSCSKCLAEQIYHTDIQKCVVVNKDSLYDPNIHGFVTGKEGYQTQPTAANLLTLGDLKDVSEVPNCPEDAPFYDDITCIKCPEPIPLFNTATKTCVACEPQQFYNSETRNCQTRQILYSNGNFENLVGFPNQSVDDYLQKIVKLQQQNPEAIDAKCKPSENSAFTSCVQCARDQVFNVASLKCIQCSSLDMVKKICYDGIYFLPNLKAANGTFIAQNGLGAYLDKIKKESKDAFDTITCPEDQPYTDGKKCFPCPQKTPYFNVDTMQCASCPRVARYDSQLQKCVQANETFILNPQYATKLVGDSPEDVENFLKAEKEANSTAKNPVLCSKDQPYTDTKQCIACKDEKPLFDVNTKKCTQCPEGKLYKEDTYTCEGCQKGTLKDGKCVQLPSFSNPKYLDNAIFVNGTAPIVPKDGIPCPKQTPFFDGNECIACDGDKNLFDVGSKSCTQCQQGTIFDKATHSCVQPSKVTNFPAGGDRILVGNNQNYDQLKKDAQSKKNVQLCPEETPFYDGSKCIDCSAEQEVFSMEKLKCMTCQNFLNFNPKTHKCEKFPQVSNLDNSNWIAQDPKKIESSITKALADNSAVQCPVSTPFSKGTECIICDKSKNETFNANTKQCEQCPKGEVVDRSKHICVEPTTRATNIYRAPNLIFDGFSQGQLEAQYEANKKAYNTTDCPKDAPYSNGVTCISCSGTKPYFNVNTLVCQNCPEGSKYDPKVHQCLSTKDAQISDANPNFEKLAANVFEHKQNKFHRLV